MSILDIGIAGAGLLGRLLAWRLARAGHRVHVHDPAIDAQPRFDGRHASSFSAAGMLSPLAELENAGPGLALLGMRSVSLWREIVEALPEAPFFAQRGSLLLAHRNDLATAQRVLARLEQAPPDMPRAQPIAMHELAACEPSLHGAAHAWLLPSEAQIDPPQTLIALHDHASELGVQWHWRQRVEQVTPGALRTSTATHEYDLVFDVRGVGARQRAPGHGSGPIDQVRGVRGETVWLHAPEHGLTRPARLLHPRHRVYLVPRPGDIVVIGATQIESEDRSPVSLRSAVELMSAAHSVMPGLAEARIVRMDANLRPALPDNEPHIDVAPGRVRINGLFRHGWLVAPALVEQALAQCGLANAHVAHA
ncbi:glycine oxidase [Burkholderiaceae bacterium]|nr:glycine oxidase [Burkholderiaceae bacterium]